MMFIIRIIHVLFFHIFCFSNVQLRMSSDSVMGEGPDATRKSSKKYDKSLLLENTLLNESLEKERSKRKVWTIC